MLDTAVFDEASFERFRRYAAALCRHRRISLHDYLPELAELLERRPDREDR